MLGGGSRSGPGLATAITLCPVANGAGMFLGRITGAALAVLLC